MTQYYMQCGHTASSYDENNNPICALCNGSHDGYNQVFHPRWEGRQAQCIYCDNTTESSADLPYFAYQPQQNADSYYCGCKDWM